MTPPEPRDSWVWLTHRRFNHHGGHSGYNQLLKYARAEISVLELRPWSGLVGAASDFARSANESRRLRRERVFHLYPEQTLGVAPWHPVAEVAACHQPPAAFSNGGVRMGLLRHSLRRASRVIALGPAQHAWLTGEGFKASLVPHGVDTSFFSPVGGETGRDLLYVGGWLRDERRLAAYSLAAQSAGFNVRRIGPGTPRLDDEQYRAALLSCVGVLLSIPDGVASNTVLEAAACGKPIIGDLAPDTSWYLGDENRVLLRRPVGEQFREVARSGGVIGASNRTRAEECSWPAVAKQLLDVLAEVA